MHYRLRARPALGSQLHVEIGEVRARSFAAALLAALLDPALARRFENLNHKWVITAEPVREEGS